MGGIGAIRGFEYLQMFNKSSFDNEDCILDECFVEAGLNFDEGAKRESGKDDISATF